MINVTSKESIHSLAINSLNFHLVDEYMLICTLLMSVISYLDYGPCNAPSPVIAVLLVSSTLPLPLASVSVQALLYPWATLHVWERMEETNINLNEERPLPVLISVVVILVRIVNVLGGLATHYFGDSFLLLIIIIKCKEEEMR